jgi:FkbM family methyltransferase
MRLMNLRVFASHTLDLDLLPQAPVVLDVGCRWFDFTREVLEARPEARIIAIDPSPDVTDPDHARVEFVRAALVGGGPAWQQLAHFSTGEGDFVTPRRTYMAGWDKQPEWHDVECFEIDEVLAMYARHFDAVKLDCEGSEFGILEHWPGPIATQISVEFHDWDKPQYRAEGYYEQLWRKLPWYRVVQHELSKQGEGVGHWDTLLVLNEKR